MKKIAVLLTIFILLFISIIAINEHASPQIRINNKKPFENLNIKTIRPIATVLPNDFIFKAEDIVLKDDAFHGVNSLNFAEWWYFDAIFDNGYSIQITIYIFDIFSNKFVVSGVNIYENLNNILSRENYYIFNNLKVSSETPYIEIDNKQLLKGYVDEISGNWIYDVTINVPGASIDLQFNGNSKGWKGDLSIGGWAVILPKAEVKGKITLFGIDKNVIGIGYHDHNWEMNVFDLFNYGWYWGKINTNNHTIVWYIIMNSRYKSDYICLISEDGGDYNNINPKNMYFGVKDFKFVNFWWIPNTFILKVDVNSLYFAILMNAISIDTHYNIRLGHYWRYHLNCLGNIIIDNEVKDVSGIQIAEFMKFRFI